MIVIGIDPGTKCGWAVRQPNGTMLSGVWNLAGNRFDGAGMRFLRARRCFTDLLEATASDFSEVPVKVAVEEVRRHLGVDAAHCYGGIVAVIMSVCEERKIPYEGVPVSAAKVTATGKGNADKPAMMAAAIYRWPGWTPADDNEADARFIAETSFAGVPEKKTKSRKKANKGVSDSETNAAPTGPSADRTGRPTTAQDSK